MAEANLGGDSSESRRPIAGSLECGQQPFGASWVELDVVVEQQHMVPARLLQAAIQPGADAEVLRQRDKCRLRPVRAQVGDGIVG